MPLLASTIIDDVKQDFEGGNSLDINWDIIIRRAVENVMDNCRPETLKRRVPLYGGLSRDLYIYYAPNDVLVPGDLYTNDQLGIPTEARRKFKYQPSKVFYDTLEFDKYTIEYINGAQFVVVRHNQESDIKTIDEMNAVGTKTGGTPTLNEHNYLQGSGAVQATFTAAGVEFKDTITAIDITAYLNGIALVPAFFKTGDAIKLSSLQLRLKTSDSAYYSVISTADSISDNIVDGWNLIRFDLANRSTTGSPNSASIVGWSLVGTTTAGNTITIIFDKITLQKFNPFYFEYYSNRPYKSGSTSALWQSTISYANADSINFNRDLAGVLHYEMCLLVTQAATFDKIDGQATKRFEGQLKRKYDAYWAVHPSSEEPPSYSKSPEIDIDPANDWGRRQDTTIASES